MPDSLAWTNREAFIVTDGPAPMNWDGVARTGQNLLMWRRFEAGRRLREARREFLAACSTLPDGASDIEFLQAHNLNASHRGTPAARALGL